MRGKSKITERLSIRLGTAKIIFSAAVLIVLCGLSGARAISHSGKNLLLYNNSAQSMGRGSASVSSLETGAFIYNPAAIAGLQRNAFSINYGTIPIQTNYYNPAVSIAIPTSYAVLGSSFRGIIIPESEDFDRGTELRIGGAKNITPNFFFGLSVNLFYGSDKEKNRLMFAGVSLAAIYKMDTIRLNNTWGIFDPKAGIALSPGIPAGKKNERADFNGAITGYNFHFFRTRKINIGFFNEFTAINNYRDYAVKTGFEAEFYGRYIIRGGFIFPSVFDYGDFAFGLGYKFHNSVYLGSADYSISYYRDRTFIHYAGLTVEYGDEDRYPPEIEIVPDKKYISPNSDGKKDYVIFAIDIYDRSKIKGWKLKILDKNGNTAREFSPSERDIIRKLTLTEFFKRLFQKKESAVAPESILWDGKNNKGEIVSDGRYFYSFYAWDEWDNIAVQKKGIIHVDNSPPEIKLKADDTDFSPNRDLRKDLLRIKQTVKSSPHDIWIAGFKNSAGKIIKTYKWKGNSAPGMLEWDGRDDRGNACPEGIYGYFISSTDRAGNSAGAEIKDITLTRKIESAGLKTGSKYFSFLKSKKINLYPSLSAKKGLESWKIIISNAEKKIVRIISGKEEPPPLIIYNCRDSSGKKLKDGVYYIKFSAKFKSGNEPSSFEKKLIVDSAPPEVEISFKPEIFSPDGDGENDMLEIYPRYKDKNGIRSWTITIYSPSGLIFKTFNGKGAMPKKLIWDGTGFNDELVESAADYLIELEAVDMAGNSSKSEPLPVPVDILVLVTERGLKIRISNINFQYKSAELLENDKKLLDRVYEILEKYKKYKILIEGHTDSRGSEKKNLILSEKRAQSVMNYLIKKGLSIKRMTFLGMGETKPLYPNTDEENRRKNRRVEFLLIK